MAETILTKQQIDQKNNGRAIVNMNENAVKKHQILPKDVSLEKLGSLNSITENINNEISVSNGLKKTNAYNFVNKNFNPEDLYIDTIFKTNIGDELKPVEVSTQNKENIIRGVPHKYQKTSVYKRPQNTSRMKFMFSDNEKKESIAFHEPQKTPLEIAREKNKIAIKDDSGQVKYQPPENIRKRYEGLRANREQALVDFAEADKNVNYMESLSPSEREGYERLWKYRANVKAEQKAEAIINERKKADAQLNSPEAKAARASGEENLENLYKETGFVLPNSSRNAYSDAARTKDLETRLSAIENNESVKRTLNYTTRSDGSMSYSSKKDYEAAQKFINEQEAEYVKTYTDEFKNDAKYKLDEKISSFVNNKDWKKEYAKMGAQNKVDLMSNLTEAQIDYVKKQGLELENIANWSEDQMESVVKGLKNAKYMDSVEEKLKQEFRTGVQQRANLAGYNKIVSRESEIASSISKKMSGFKSVGKLAIGGALMYGLVSALSDSSGQQSNAQLYGQQPLY